MSICEQGESLIQELERVNDWQIGMVFHVFAMKKPTARIVFKDEKRVVYIYRWSGLVDEIQHEHQYIGFQSTHH